jgi:hypothetical protein
MSDVDDVRDESQNNGMLDDDHDEFVVYFQASADVNGLIDVATLIEILDRLGIATDELAVDELLGRVPRDAIGIDNARDVMQMLRVTDDDAADAAVTHIKEVVQIDFFSYVGRKLTCAETPPNVTYDVVAPSVDLKPRHKIISAMGLTAVICCSLMIAGVALLWTDHAVARELQNVEVLGATTSNFFSSFEQEMIRSNGLTLNGTAARVSQLFDAGFAIVEASTAQQLRRRAHHRGTGVTGAAVHAVNDTLVAVHRSLLVLATVARGRLAAAGAVNETWVDEMVARLALRVTGVSFNVWSFALGATRPGSATACTGAACLVRSPCLGNTTPFAVYNMTQTRDLAGGAAMAVAVTFGASAANAAVAVCATLGHAGYIRIGQAAMTVALPQINVATLPSPLPSESAGAIPNAASSSASPLVSWVTPLTYGAAACHAAGTCRQQDAAVNVVLNTRHDIAAPLGGDRTGVPAVLGAHATAFDFAIVETVHRSELRTWVLDFYNKPQIKHLNYQRIQLQGSTQEAVIMIQNVSTGAVSEAFQGIFTTCFGACVRPSQAFANAVRGFEEKTGGWSITPDYRPEAVVGGYRYAADGILDIVIIFERDVVEVRRLALSLLAQIVNTVNVKSSRSLEVMMVGRKHELRTKTFLPNAVCPATVACLSSPGYGVVYRSDCSHCTRHVDSPTREIEFISDVSLIDDCRARGRNCSTHALENNAGTLANHVVFNTAELPKVYDGVYDYRGVEVLAYGGYVENFSTSFYIKQDRRESLDTIELNIYTSVGASAGVILFLTIGFIVFASSTLDKIELEWGSYNELIHDERLRFTEAHRDIMPQHMADHVIRQLPLVNESTQACVAFVEVLPSSSRADFAATALCRFVTYIHHALDVFAVHYAVHRVSIVGDLCCFASGLSDGLAAEASSGTSLDNNTVIRMLRFLGNVFQITGQRYAHFQQRCPLIRANFAEHAFCFSNIDGDASNQGTIKMPQMRAGISFGNVHQLIQHYECGLPRFDLAGAPVSFAYRLCQASRHLCIVASEPVKELTLSLQAAEKRVITFARKQKIALRGRRTANAYFVTASTVPIPAQLLQGLGVRYARLRKYFVKEDATKADDFASSVNSWGSSVHSKSSRGSVASSRHSVASSRHSVHHSGSDSHTGSQSASVISGKNRAPVSQMNFF